MEQFFPYSGEAVRAPLGNALCTCTFCGNVTVETGRFLGRMGEVPP